MNGSNINLCVFDTTKQHFGRKEIYQKTIKDLYNKIPFNFFDHLYVHIKISDNEIEQFEKQKNFYEGYGFEVFSTIGDWSHFSESHQRGYCADLIKMYGEVVDRNVKYCLHLESDWLFSPNGGLQLSDYINKCEYYLYVQKNVMCVRFPRFYNEVDRLNNLKIKHGINVEVKKDGKFWRHNDNFSANPCILRTSDMTAATRLLELNFNQFGHHIEHGFTKCLSVFSREKLCYSIIEPDEITVCHIGCKEGEEDIIGIQTLEKI